MDLATLEQVAKNLSIKDWDIEKVVKLVDVLHGQTRQMTNGFVISYRDDFQDYNDVSYGNIAYMALHANDPTCREKLRTLLIKSNTRC